MKPRKTAPTSVARELLLEIGVEEMPSNVMADTLRQLQEVAAQHLRDDALPFDTVQTFGTPRRLILVVPALADVQTARTTQVIGPPKRAAFDAAGNPTPAAIGFARSQDVEVGALTGIQTEKGEYLAIEKRLPGQATATRLPILLPEILKNLTFPKAMRWNETAVAFARPIRWIVALYAGEVAPFQYAGVASDCLSRGHRILAPKPFRVTTFAAYQKEMARRYVVIDPKARYDRIVAEMTALAHEAHGVVALDDDLLWRAAWTTECPTPLCGAFDPQFLDLPPEVITTVMTEHQGDFPLHTTSGELLPTFITIANLSSERMDVIRRGNERVLRARLVDARFYDDQDRKMKLGDRVPALRQVTFQEKLGTLHDKIERVSALCLTLARDFPDVPPDVLRRAALLYKCDLLTGVVREFPSLQGTVGRIYALRDGESSDVATAIEAHYLPRFAGDRLPSDRTSGLLSVADKLDTIVGCFGVGLIPSGSEDPHALRRQGLGLVQILAGAPFRPIRLTAAVAAAVAGYASQARFSSAGGGVAEAVGAFLAGRMASWQKGCDMRYDLVDAVLARPFDRPFDALRWIVALSEAARAPHFEALVTCVKRASRILPPAFSGEVDPARLTDDAEVALHAAIQKTEAQVDAMGQRTFSCDDVLQTLSALAGPLGRFFDGVLVMAPDAAVRQNRLGLCLRVCRLFDRVADFSKIEGGGPSTLTAT
jgi:glycyl-tRNA synthetase beta chain